jgi:hypothetical protein
LFLLCRLRWWVVPRAATTSSCPRFYVRTKTINYGIVLAVQVEVVGGPQGGHHQLLPQISIPNTATTVAYTLTQPYAFQIPAPPLQQHYQQQFTQQQVP